MSHSKKKLEKGTNITFSFRDADVRLFIDYVQVRFLHEGLTHSFTVSRKTFNKLQTGKFKIKSTGTMYSYAGGLPFYIPAISLSKKDSNKVVTTYGRVLRIPEQFVVPSRFSSVSLGYGG